MKKALKRILIGIGAIILIIVLLFLGYLIKAKTEMNKMTPAETGEIINSIYSVQDSFTNMYLVKEGEHFIAFDAANDHENVSEELKKLNINPDKIKAIFLTHSDGDHVASIKLFKNAKVYLSREEEKLLNGEESRFLFFGNKIDAKEYNLLHDQQIVNFGNIKIKCILIPGHTPGSMCYLVNDKYLFTGDALSIKEGKINKFNEFFNMDTDQAIESIEKITHFSEAEYIFTAHYGYTDDYKNAVEGWEN